MSDLYFDEAGQGAPLLLIHGTGGDSDVWQPLASLFAKERRVIRYDRRGFGRSAGAPHGRRQYYRRHGDDAAQLLDQLGAAPASVIGWSAGGIVALALAAFHPRAVSRLVLFEPPLWAARHPSAAMLGAFAKMMFFRALGRKQRAAEVFVRTAVGRSGEERIDSEQRKKLFDNVDGLFAEIDGGTGEEIAPEQLRAAGCPITHVVGQNSAPFLAAAAERLAKEVPSVHILRVPDADHLALSEQPERFLALLRPLV